MPGSRPVLCNRRRCAAKRPLNDYFVIASSEAAKKSIVP
jgi:hypothetical protein